MQERRLPKENVLLVDVGANIGALSLATAALGFSVLAFEPMHANLWALRHSLCANAAGLRGRVALVPKVGKRVVTCPNKGTL